MGGTSVSVPASRGYYGETAGALNAQQRLAPSLYAAEAQWTPQYTNLATQNLGTAANGLLGLYGTAANSLANAESSALGTQRAGDVSQWSQYGQQASNAILGANPMQQQLVTELNRQALSGLQQGTALSADQTRAMQQQARAGYAARGLNNSGAAIGDEVLRQYNLGQTNQDRNRLFAGSVAGINQATTGDAVNQLFNRQGQAFGMTPTIGTQAYGVTSGIGPQLFQPESQYKADLMNQMYQAQLAASTANASNNAALKGAWIGAAGQSMSSL